MRSSVIRLFIVMLIMWPCHGRADDGDSINAVAQGNGSVGSVLRKLSPKHVVIQNAGNMGWLSAGVGWEYGRRKQWETQVLVGFVPKHMAESAKMTLTAKENFIPWTTSLSHGWALQPLHCGLYINAVFGSAFWNHQPSRYPNNYYFFSTRFRTNIFIGQRLTKTLDIDQLKWMKSVTAFYEISSCDLYMVDFFSNRSMGLWDVLGLSLGIKLQLF